jgi:hypothetical protein
MKALFRQIPLKNYLFEITACAIPVSKYIRGFSIGMRSRHESRFAGDRVGRILFPKLTRSARRKNMRFLFLSLFLGLMCAAAFVCLLLLMNRGNNIWNPLGSVLPGEGYRPVAVFRVLA